MNESIDRSDLIDIKRNDIDSRKDYGFSSYYTFNDRRVSESSELINGLNVEVNGKTVFGVYADEVNLPSCIVVHDKSMNSDASELLYELSSTYDLPIEN